MTTTRIRIREDVLASPVCLHCGKEIQEIAARRVESALGVRFCFPAWVQCNRMTRRMQVQPNAMEDAG